MTIILIIIRILIGILIMGLIIHIVNLKSIISKQNYSLKLSKSFYAYGREFEALMAKSKAEYIDDGTDSHDANYKLTDKIILRYNSNYFNGFYLNNKQVSLRVVIRKLIKYNLI